MEFISVPASQIMPVSGIETPLSLAKIRDETDTFLFSKGPVPYKIWKNALASSTGINKNTQEFMENFFDVLEGSIRLQMKERGNTDKTLLLKDAFDSLRSTFRLLNKAGIDYEPITFYCALIGLILGKLR